MTSQVPSLRTFTETPTFQHPQISLPIVVVRELFDCSSQVTRSAQPQYAMTAEPGPWKGPPASRQTELALLALLFHARHAQFLGILVLLYWVFLSRWRLMLKD